MVVPACCWSCSVMEVEVGGCGGLAPCMRRESERGRNPSQVAGYGPPAFRIIISYRESEPASGATDEGRGGGTPYNACYTARAPAPAATECALGKTRGAWEPATMMLVRSGRWGCSWAGV